MADPVIWLTMQSELEYVAFCGNLRGEGSLRANHDANQQCDKPEEYNPGIGIFQSFHLSSVSAMKRVGEGTLVSPVRAVSWSPAVDLCIFVAATEVSAHRLSGQRVWTIDIQSLHALDLEFTHLAWRQDGIPGHKS